MAYRILVTEPMSEDGPDWLRAHGYEVKYGRGIDTQTLIEDLRDCDGVIPRLAVMSDEVISACPRLKVVARHGAGVDTVDLDSCRKHGVRVVNTRGSNSRAVAEHAMMMIMACAKALNNVQRLYMDGKFAEARKTTVSVEVGEKTLGLLGVGNIGKIVAQIAAQGFQMKVIAYDPYAKRESLPEGVELLCDRDEIFKRSDFISIHMAATKETKGSIGMREFKLMKPTAYLINTARGTIIKEDELIEALDSHVIAGAGLDTTDPEPADEKNPLFHMNNVIMTPHCGGSTQESKRRSSLGAAKGCDEILTGKTPTSPVL